MVGRRREAGRQVEEERRKVREAQHLARIFGRASGQERPFFPGLMTLVISSSSDVTVLYCIGDVSGLYQ